MLGIVDQAKRVRDRMQAIVRLNIELAKLEGKQKATALGIALGLALLAALLVVYAVGFLFAAAAVGIAEALPLWAALLIVAAVILALAATAGYFAVRFARKVAPPEPPLMIDEAKLTVETLRGA